MNVPRLPALIGIALAGVVVVAAGMTFTARRRVASTRPTVSPLVRAPDSVRIKVQVLNGTKTRGLARRATQLLRDHGFDVVDMGTASAEGDTTLVLDLSGHPEWAQRVARNFTPSRVETRTDSSRYLDVTVVLGAAWRPPAKPFYP